MNSLKTKIEQKLGDHPNVNANDETNPDSGIGKGMNQGNDQGRSWVDNKIQAGQGSGDPNDPGPRAGGTTAADTMPAGSTSGAIGEAPR